MTKREEAYGRAFLAVPQRHRAVIRARTPYCAWCGSRYPCAARVEWQKARALIGPVDKA